MYEAMGCLPRQTINDLCAWGEDGHITSAFKRAPHTVGSLISGV